MKMVSGCLRILAGAVAVTAGAAILSGTLLARTNQVPAKVDSVEPASWKMGASTEIIVRLSGDHLDRVEGAKVKHKGIRVIHMQAEDDNHLLVTLHISPNAEPGTLVLQVFTHYMTTFAELPMLQSGDTRSGPGELAASN
jgi:hypothetical protein